MCDSLLMNSLACTSVLPLKCFKTAHVRFTTLLSVTVSNTLWRSQAWILTQKQLKVYLWPEALYGFEGPLVDSSSSWFCAHSGVVSGRTPAKSEHLWQAFWWVDSQSHAPLQPNKHTNLLRHTVNLHHLENRPHVCLQRKLFKEDSTFWYTFWF